MSDTFIVRVASPAEDLYHHEAYSVHISLRDGLYEVLPMHMDEFFELVVGGLYIHTTHGLKSFFIKSGVCLVSQNTCYISVVPFHESIHSDELTVEQHKIVNAKEMHKKNVKQLS